MKFLTTIAVCMSFGCTVEGTSNNNIKISKVEKEIRIKKTVENNVEALLLEENCLSQDTLKRSKCDSRFVDNMARIYYGCKRYGLYFCCEQLRMIETLDYWKTGVKLVDYCNLTQKTFMLDSMCLSIGEFDKLKASLEMKCRKGIDNACVFLAEEIYGSPQYRNKNRLTWKRKYIDTMFQSCKRGHIAACHGFASFFVPDLPEDRYSKKVRKKYGKYYIDIATESCFEYDVNTCYILRDYLYQEYLDRVITVQHAQLFVKVLMYIGFDDGNFYSTVVKELSKSIRDRDLAVLIKEYYMVENENYMVGKRKGKLKKVKLRLRNDVMKNLKYFENQSRGKYYWRCFDDKRIVSSFLKRVAKMYKQKDGP